MAKKPNYSLLILAGIGFGVIAGATIGLLVARRGRTDPVADIAETVDDLRDKAERVLRDLSDSITELKETTQRMAAEVD
jgi:hypothetical protein